MSFRKIDAGEIGREKLDPDPTVSGESSLTKFIELGI